MAMIIPTNKKWQTSFSILNFSFTPPPLTLSPEHPLTAGNRWRTTGTAEHLSPLRTLPSPRTSVGPPLPLASSRVHCSALRVVVQWNQSKAPRGKLKRTSFFRLSVLDVYSCACAWLSVPALLPLPLLRPMSLHDSASRVSEANIHNRWESRNDLASCLRADRDKGLGSSRRSPSRPNATLSLWVRGFSSPIISSSFRSCLSSDLTSMPQLIFHQSLFFLD